MRHRGEPMMRAALGEAIAMRPAAATLSPSPPLSESGPGSANEIAEFIPRSELSEFDLGFGDRGSSSAACLFARTKIPAVPSSGRGTLAGGIFDSRCIMSKFAGYQAISFISTIDQFHLKLTAHPVTRPFPRYWLLRISLRACLCIIASSSRIL